MREPLGQHFLINQKVLKAIAQAISPEKDEMIIEIGPGHGELTGHLVKAGAHVIAIEKDQELARKLKEKYSGQNIEIIEGDALQILPKLVEENKNTMHGYKLVGNIPYYITGKLFRIASELSEKPKSIVVLIQKEVAERIVSMPPNMNLLAASIQFWAKPYITTDVPKKDFRPQPKVDSAVISLTPFTPLISPEAYYPFIKILFKQPRKTIYNNLREVFDEQKIETVMSSVGIAKNERAQSLNIKQMILLLESLMEQKEAQSRSKA